MLKTCMWWKRRSAIKRGVSIKKDKYEEASLVIRKKQLIKKKGPDSKERSWVRVSDTKGVLFLCQIQCKSCKPFLYNQAIPSPRVFLTINGWATWIFNMGAQDNTEAGWLAKLLNPNLISIPAVWEVLRRHYVPISCQETQVGSLAVSHWEHCYEVRNYNSKDQGIHANTKR